MTAIVTTLTEFSDNGNTRVYTLPGHLAASQRIMTQKRKVPVGNQKVIEDVINIQYTTSDSEGNALPQKVGFTATITRPIGADAADITGAEAVFKDIVQSDEFSAMIQTQNYVK